MFNLSSMNLLLFQSLANLSDLSNIDYIPHQINDLVHYRHQQYKQDIQDFDNIIKSIEIENQIKMEKKAEKMQQQTQMVFWNVFRK